MIRLTNSAEWGRLLAHRDALGDADIAALFAADPDRAAGFTHEAAGLSVDFSKQPLVGETLELLIDLARSRGLRAGIDAMFAGARLNRTEDRAVLHVALRNGRDETIELNGNDVMRAVRAVHERLRGFCAAVYRDGRITDVVNLGIGGSDLGPRLAAQALRPCALGHVRSHFVANIDPAALAQTLASLEPAHTLVVIASKSFTTTETMHNARAARDWLRQGGVELDAHLAAVTANPESAAAFGVAAERVFEFWDWVGGRYSLWSAIGLPLMLEIGPDNFLSMLAGAHAMDEHFRSAAPQTNLPVLLALTEIWQRNFLGAAARAVVPYSDGLALLPQYLQQAEMESNGKSRLMDGSPAPCATAPVVFGQPGTDAQHAFFQLLHQGTDVIPVDFILPLRSHYAPPGHQDLLVSNCIAQAEALLLGRDQGAAEQSLVERGVPASRARELAPHLVCPGNRPSTMILLERLDPAGLGALLALYEHKIFVAGLVWGINSFDQWGVELGKTLAAQLLPELEPGAQSGAHDGSTLALLARVRAGKK